MVEVTQADRDAAEAVYPAFLASLKGEDGGYGLAEAFARHRTPSLAAQDGLVDALHGAKAFIEAVAENDPDEPIADNGATVWDGLQSSAPKVIAKLEAALASIEVKS